MLSEQTFNHWAPPGGLWTPWAKPVMFLNLDAAITAPPPPVDQFQQLDTSFAVPPGDAAYVIDLPGERSVMLGVAMAYKGYRPVPLFNCCTGPSAVLDVRPIVRAILAGAEALDVLNLPWDAPPAFLLDAHRTTGGGQKVAPGMFDNRWITLPQDFPSANLLLSKNIRRAILVQDRPGQPRDDLAHVVLRWQEAGVAIEGTALDPSAMTPVSAPTQPLKISKPAWFGAMFYTVLATMGLRRNSAGGFGSVVPHPSSGGGYG
jgi:hypothetical protein